MTGRRCRCVLVRVARGRQRRGSRQRCRFAHLVRGWRAGRGACAGRGVVWCGGRALRRGASGAIARGEPGGAGDEVKEPGGAAGVFLLAQAAEDLFGIVRVVEDAELRLVELFDHEVESFGGGVEGGGGDGPRAGSGEARHRAELLGDGWDLQPRREVGDGGAMTMGDIEQ